MDEGKEIVKICSYITPIGPVLSAFPYRKRLKKTVGTGVPFPPGIQPDKSKNCEITIKRWLEICSKS